MRDFFKLTFPAGLLYNLLSVTLFHVELSAFLFAFSLSLPSFHVCRHIQRIHTNIYFVFRVFKNFRCFSKRISLCNFPPNKQTRTNTGALALWDCVRTDGRTDKSEAITKPKFLPSTGYQNLLAMEFRYQ